MTETKRAVAILFVTALFFYFYSESILRQSALSKLKTPKFSVDVILSKMPTYVRASAKKSLEIAKLEDYVAEAKTDREKVTALVNLATATESTRQKAKIFAQVVKLPRFPEAASAYAYFLSSDNSKQAVSMEEYHKFINECERGDRFSAWNHGIMSLEEKELSADVKMKFLKPLLNESPKFSDFRILYRKIADIALKTNDFQALEKAGFIIESCLYLPSINEEASKFIEEKKK